MAERTKPWEETWTPADSGGFWWYVRLPAPEGSFGPFHGADAKLIAAAPDMARALLAFEQVFRGHWVTPIPGSPPGLLHDALAAADAALKKAGVR